MEKEYLSYTQQNIPPQAQPPKKDNRVVILLSVISALLLVIIIALIVIFSIAINKEEKDENKERNTAAQVQESEDSTLKPGADNNIPSFPEGQTGESVTDTSSTAPSQALVIGGNTPNSIPSIPSGGLSIGGGPNLGGSSGIGSIDAPAYGTADGTTDGATAGTADGTTDGAAAGTENAGPKVPSTVEEVLACYNNAVNKVITDKAGYTKKRTTTLDMLDGGALLKIQLVVDMVNDFLGVGTTEYKNEKGKAEFLSKASLTANDLSSIDFANNDGIYTITLGLKPGQSQASGSGSSDTTPLQRSGVYVGKGGKKAFDYKSSENIHTAINGVATADSCKETVTNATIVAKVDSANGRLISLEVKWNWNVELTNVSYSIATVKTANATATSTVTVSDFKW